MTEFNEEMASLEVLDLYSEVKPLFEGEKTNVALSTLGVLLLSIVRSDRQFATPILVMIAYVVKEIEQILKEPQK